MGEETFNINNNNNSDSLNGQNSKSSNRYSPDHFQLFPAILS